MIQVYQYLGGGLLAEFTNSSLAVDCTNRLAAGGNPYTEIEGREIAAVVLHHQATYSPKGEDCINGWIAAGKQTSANYCVGDDGSIALYVPEKYRAWTTGTDQYGSNPDRFSVTIELSNCNGCDSANGSDEDPEAWKVSSTAWESCIRLIADIYKRNGISKCVYKGGPNGEPPNGGNMGPKNSQMSEDVIGNLLMHRWYASTACPGGYMMHRFEQVASEVNAILTGSPVTPNPGTPGSTDTSYTPANKIIFDPYPTVVELGSIIQVTTDASGCPIVMTTDNSAPVVPDALCDLGDECTKALEGDYKKTIKVQKCTHIRAIAIGTDNTIKAQGAGTFIVKWKRPKDEDVQSIIEAIERETNQQPYLALNLEEKKKEVHSFKELKSSKNAY